MGILVRVINSLSLLSNLLFAVDCGRDRFLLLDLGFGSLFLFISYRDRWSDLCGSFGQRKELKHVDTFQLILNVGAKIVFLFFQEEIEVAVLGHLLLKVGNEVVVSVEELGVLINMLGCLVDFVKVLFIYTVVLDKRLIFRLIDSHLDYGVGQLGKLDSFLQETDSSLLKGYTANSLVFNSLDFNFLSSHFLCL